MTGDVIVTAVLTALGAILQRHDLGEFWFLVEIRELRRKQI